MNFTNNHNTGNDIPILHEIKHALEQLINRGESTTIDLRAIPMAPGEETRIIETLGEGEISTTLNALGPSTIVETAISGVWLITHFNFDAVILGKFIEISKVSFSPDNPGRRFTGWTQTALKISFCLRHR